ncbi:hypothetical protein LO763_11575 [Glycomyces sp. A-F 0318]|uniref:hypothetical protein n=1 Tax=Glycomyces amatae TaxID=2881355 RepID=UPI001E4BE07F|nr:hypothetical protein [Glycomyces amatae]MCD0444261.1 hypothetical protein [Glycomyces amatae]
MPTKNISASATMIRVSSFTLASLLIAAACTDTSDIPADPTSTASEPPSHASSPSLAPEAIEDPEQAAIAAYTRYWEQAMRSFAAPDGDFTEFEALATGQALEQAIAIEQRGIDEGTHGEGDIIHHVTVKDTLLTDEVQQVVLIDCADSTQTQVLDAEDNPVAGEEYGYREVQSRVELLDGYWIVTAMAVQEIGSCVPDDS